MASHFRIGEPCVAGESEYMNTAPILALKSENLSRLDMRMGSTQSYRPRGSTISSMSSAHSASSWSSISSKSTASTETATDYTFSQPTTNDDDDHDIVGVPSTRHTACKPPLKVVLGTASIGSSKSPLARITSVKDLQDFVWSFRSRGYADIDTARAYPIGRGGTCEKMLGEDVLKLNNWSNVSTKVASFMPGSHKSKNIAASIQQSLDNLKVDSVDIMYLHAPDRTTSFLETCKAMDEAYRQGKFERFGLSNYSVDQVVQIIQICQDHDLVRPTVYQGQYNPVCRGAEAKLFEILRNNHIAFYAYSPSACGFFSDKMTRALANDSKSRWNAISPLGAKYTGDYFHDALFAAAEIVKVQARKYGISGHAAALRWTTWHSHLDATKGDALIIGASSLTQLEENLDILEEGPLPESLVLIMNRMWQEVESFGKGPKYSMVH